MAEKRFQAVVFDMDGLMFDSEPLYYELVDTVLKMYGKRMSPELSHAMMGRRRMEAIEVLRQWHQLTVSVDSLAAAADALYFSTVGDRLQPMPGLFSLLEYLKQHNIPRAVATSSARSYADHGLARWNLTDFFSFILAGEDVSEGKPDPEIYQLAARRFGIETEQMLVLEDSQTGLQAAKAARAICIAIPQEHNRGQDFSMADACVETLESPIILEMLQGQSKSDSSSKP